MQEKTQVRLDPDIAKKIKALIVKSKRSLPKEVSYQLERAISMPETLRPRAHLNDPSKFYNQF